ncbi:MAG: tryptophan 7-halogenase [Fuerstiella sp.]
MSESIRSQQPAAAPLRFPKRVVILGDDVCAWMSATVLLRHFGRLGIQVTVCSDGHRTNRTGQQAVSTTAALTKLLKNIGIDEHDLLRACQGTYKLATQYSDWATDGRDFWQPLGANSQRVAGRPIFDAWFSERKAGRLLRPLHSYAAHWTAALAGKSPHSFSSTSDFAASGEYGFHVDATNLASWFREVALKSGAEEVCAPIAKSSPNGRGGIAQVVCDDSKAIPGDLFLECRLIDENQRDGANWISWDDQFQCDRMASIRTASKRQVPVFTRACGHDHGWSLTIPLAKSVQTSYAFDSKFHTDSQAADCLHKICGGDLGSDASTDAKSDDKIEFSQISSGRRTTFWKDNVVHLGNSACRLDSVAHTDLHLQQSGIELLLELFPDRNIGKATRTEYNSKMASLTNEFQDVVRLHHELRRRPTSGCRATSDKTSPALDALVVSAELKQLLEVYDACGEVTVRNSQSMPAAEIRGLLAGCGRLPQRPSLTVRSAEPNHIQDVLRQAVKHNETVVKDLPLHEELLDWIYNGPFQQNVG